MTPQKSRIPLRRALWLTLLLNVFCVPSGSPQETASLAADAIAKIQLKPDESLVIETSGSVLYRLDNGPVRPAKPGLILKHGSQLRTNADSRATIQLSDRSVVRIGERAILELMTPKSRAKKRFRLLRGSLFFLNREAPGTVDFETPIASGAIRGTEFVLKVDEHDTELALIDGEVALTANQESFSLGAGERVTISEHTPVIRTTLVQAVDSMQWALHYPAVLDINSIAFTDEERSRLRSSLAAYRVGAMQRALREYRPPKGPLNDAEILYKATLLLSVGSIQTTLELLSDLPNSDPNARAIRTLIDAMRFAEPISIKSDTNASLSLAKSYVFQSQYRLPEARDAARDATDLAPEFGLAWLRLAHLEFALERLDAARFALERARQLTPEHPGIPSAEGFIHLSQNNPKLAATFFDDAIERDPAFADPWLGRAILFFGANAPELALRALQVAAALEPQRSLVRSHLAKGFAELGEMDLAQKELSLAKRLDPHDPSPWFYDALRLHQLGRLNEAARSLQQSADLNEHQALFKSRVALDRDLSIRAANQALIHQELGMSEVARRSAAHSVHEDYLNPSAHLYMAQSLQDRQSPSPFNLRYETPYQSELALANLLGNPASANLSAQFSQQERLHYFASRPLGASTFTEYRDNGDFTQMVSVYGTEGPLSYAVDGAYLKENGYWPHQTLEQNTLATRIAYQANSKTRLYLQIESFNSQGQDLALRYRQDELKPRLWFEESQSPNVLLGLQRQWNPNNVTLAMLGRHQDTFQYFDPQPNTLFLRRESGAIREVRSTPFTQLDFDSQFNLWTGEFQHIWRQAKTTLITGGRLQHGEIDNTSTLSRPLSGVIDQSSVAPNLNRGALYAYSQFDLIPRLRLTTGVSLERLEFPTNSEIPPLDSSQSERGFASPKLGVDWELNERSRIRAAYSHSLGGLFFDNGIRLEPTQIAGFTQTFRSLIPESIAGLSPASRFRTAGLAFDHTASENLFLGANLERLRSDNSRTVGAFTNGTALPVPDTAARFDEHLEFQETRLNVYANRLIGDHWAASARYRWSHAHLETRTPSLPNAAAGVDALERDETSSLGEVAFNLNYNHPSGFFGAWNSSFLHQNNKGYETPLDDSRFWTHDAFVGYRLKRRTAEFRAGILNISDVDYQLAPLNNYGTIPRGRTVFVSLRFNF